MSPRRSLAPALVAAVVVDVVVGGVAAGACASEPPRVDQVLPRVVDEGEDSPVRITGAHFHWRYDALTGSAEGAFRILAGDVPLEEVVWVDATELEAVVPATLPAGSYDVVVDGPTGQGAREDALEVRAP